jgi:succinate dehydrogenase flavin-adding protein (antitoxin of CptAB toxin-antitoxin module)
MDILLSNFVNKYINEFNDSQLNELEKFLNFEDEIILNYYQHNIVKDNIDQNEISKIFKNFKI